MSCGHGTERLTIKPITRIAGNARRLLQRHLARTCCGRLGNSQRSAAVENYTRERKWDKDTSEENQGTIVASPFPQGKETQETIKQRPAPQTPSSACVAVAFSLWSVCPEARHVRRLVSSPLLPSSGALQSDESLLSLALSGPRSTTQTGTVVVTHLTSSSRRYRWRTERGEKINKSSVRHSRC